MLIPAFLKVFNINLYEDYIGDIEWMWMISELAITKDTQFYHRVFARTYSNEFLESNKDLHDFWIREKAKFTLQDSQVETTKMIRNLFFMKG